MMGVDIVVEGPMYSSNYVPCQKRDVATAEVAVNVKMSDINVRIVSYTSDESGKDK